MEKRTDDEKNTTLADREAPESVPETAAEECAETEAGDTGFFAKLKACSEAEWKKYNLIGGIILGLTVGFAIFYLSGVPEFSGVSTIVAVVVALFVPRMIENNAGRSVRAGRKWMAISLGALLLIQVARWVLSKGQIL